MDIELIPKCVINLPERVDRLTQLEGELKWLFFDETYHLVNGIRHQRPATGIAQAHLLCVEYAKKKGWPYVIIMEDDCIFQGKHLTREYVSLAMENLPNQWDLLISGVYETNGLKKFNEYWSKTSEFCGLHFYIVNSGAYDRILSYNDTMHIDRWMASRGELKCYVTNKFFATQSNGFSDNVNSPVNYSDKLRRFALL